MCIKELATSTTPGTLANTLSCVSTPTAQRPSASADPVRVRFDRFELDKANATLRRDGETIAVAPTPFAVLCALARQPASLLTKNALLDQVWGHQASAEHRHCSPSEDELHGPEFGRHWSPRNEAITPR